MAMQKSILIISYQRLIINGTSGEAVACGLVEAALNRGFKVTYLGLTPAAYDDSKDIPFVPPKNLDLLTQELATYAQRTGNRIDSFIFYFDHGALEYLIQPCPALERSYDGVVAMDSLAISLAKGVDAKTRFGIIGDPVGQRFWHSKFLAWKRRFVAGTIIWYMELRYFRRKLDSKWNIGMFGTAHARRSSRILHRPVIDLRPFLSPSGKNGDSHSYGYAPADSRVVVVFGGTLATTASRLAFQFLNRDLLPELRTTIGVGRFTFKIVGSYLNEYASLAQQFPEVILTGRVPVFETELAGGDAFVLPMNYPVGVRTRVCAALQAGCYCVCDPSVLVNMPELADCKTITFADRPRAYVQAIAALQTDPESRAERKRISKAFFAEHYACDVAAKPILDVLC